MKFLTQELPLYTNLHNTKKKENLNNSKQEKKSIPNNKRKEKIHTM